MRLPLGRRIFLGTTLVVVAVLGAALLATKRRADAAADDASARALGATASSIEEALASRSLTLLRLTQALVQVPAYVSRIGESLRAGDRANLLDQADELRVQTGADWVLVTDGGGVLQAWTAQRSTFGEDFSRGALIGRAMEGQVTQGLWLEPTDEGDALYQAVGVPVVNPGSTTPFGVVVGALRVDSAFAAQLHRNTDSEILFFSLDTLGVPQVAISTLPPELVADLMEVGICLAGGGAQIQGLAERLEDVVKMRVWIAEDSMTCVARGAARVLEDLDNYSRVLVGLDRGSTHH